MIDLWSDSRLCCISTSSDRIGTGGSEKVGKSNLESCLGYERGDKGRCLSLRFKFPVEDGSSICFEAAHQ